MFGEKKWYGDKFERKDKFKVKIMLGLDIFYEEIRQHEFFKFLDNPKKLAFYGAGKLCEKLMPNAQEYSLPVELIVDAEKTGSLRDVSIVSRDDFFAGKGGVNFKEYKFLIMTSEYLYAVGRELLARGVAMEDIYAPRRQFLINGHGMGDFQIAQAYFSILDMKVHKEHYYHVYSHLVDEESKEIFLAILRYRAYGIYTLDKELYAPDEGYFHTEYLKLGSQECFCDVGAYVGDSIIEFLMKTNHRYKQIYAVEVDRQCCVRLKKNLQMEYDRGKIEVLNVGAGSRRETIVCDGCKDERWEVYRLDELLKDRCVTLIKMDIEGMELEAIKGAEEIIKTQKPNLAICVYHLVQDIWKIQEKLMQMVPEYQFCLTQPVNWDMIETVLYAFINK